MNNFIPIRVVPHQIHTTNEMSLFISRPLIKKWKLKLNSMIKVCIGKHYMTLEVCENESNEDLILISERLLEESYLPIQTYTFFAQFINSAHTLRLAPLIGLLTEVNEDDLENPNFRSVHSFSEELDYVTNHLGGFFYVFSLQSMNEGFITGFYNQDGKWNKARLPIPDVIYNRIHSRRIEHSTSFHQFRDQIQSDFIPMFNDRFLSKWEVYDVLFTEEHLRAFIPSTKLYSKKNLEDMLDQHDTLFIKPIHGSQGRNIIRLEKEGFSSYSIQFSYFKEKQNSLHITNLDELHVTLLPFIKKSSYLIQQGIPFIQHQNRFIDFRVLCHKNNQDIWNVTSSVARLSADKQFVSNIARGGETMKPLKALSLFFDRKTAKQQMVLMKELAVEFASIMGQNSEGLTGELGIDIGIDKEGHPWLIEINSKPSKNFEEQEIKIRPSAKAIVSYCLYLGLEHATQKLHGYSSIKEET
ncbi:YheC/YheD family endospore coat-associated protein [Neobacillus sp. D3-1R]|uniref:YheC/YheD family endospore coat-associated protein n=1 Tax=Neobacillus sp. D3-1R TaxID=3445778 RepID=UPI003FA093B0